MNADQARQVLLVRAAEIEPHASTLQALPSTPLWSAADSGWADDQTLRQLGENASGEQFLIERARLAAERLADRNPTMAMMRDGAGGSSAKPVIIALLLGLALLAGLATDALGPAQQVNLLAPPLLALMLWNLVVYAVLLTHAGWHVLARPDLQTGPRWFEQGASRLMQKLSRKRLRADAPAAAHRFAADWLMASRPIDAARLATLLHLAALAVAAGALLALYARGLVFEFKAGWDSTFVGADTVHRWLSLLLAPAQSISGQELPDATHLETLRFSNGDGENAARWIHWYAITTGLVMVPRAALAAAALIRARHLQRHFPLAMSEPYFQRLLQRLARASGKTAQFVAVLPYGHRMAGDLASGVATAVDAELGPGLHLKVLANIPLGAEDELASDWPRAALADADVAWLMPLFPLSATPERETHGAFLRIVQQRAAALPGRPRCRVMIDESGFRQRMAAADLPRRLADRRAAWQKLLDEHGAGQALFADLGDRPAPSQMHGTV